MKDTFGIKPKIGWQIDAYGHSNANTQLFAEMGLEANVFSRINSKMKHAMRYEKEWEFLWNPEFAFESADQSG